MPLLEYLLSNLESILLVVLQGTLNIGRLLIILCLDWPNLSYFVKLTGLNLLCVSKLVIVVILRL